jgi:translation initiation factor IF-2
MIQITDGLANQCEDVVSVRIVDASVGNITSTDVDNAFTASKNGSNPAILAFNVNLADSQTRSLANEIDVPILKSNIIYRIEDELKEIIESVAPKEKIYVKEVRPLIEL